MLQIRAAPRLKVTLQFSLSPSLQSRLQSRRGLGQSDGEDE